MTFRRPSDIDQANLSYYCRSCRNIVRGIPINDFIYRSSGYGDNEAWAIVRCPTQYCDLSFIIYDTLNSQIRRVFPFPNFDSRDFHISIPDEIKEDLAEAKKCFHANAYKGTVTMLRRAIQNMIIDKIPDPKRRGKDLYQQIEELFNQGFITRKLKDTAHEIRHFGNYGAHPSDDLLDNVSREDAEIIDVLTSELINTVYIIPYETQKLTEKRINNGK